MDSLFTLQVFLSACFGTGALFNTVLYALRVRFPGAEFWIVAQTLIFVGATIDLIPARDWSWLTVLSNGTQASGALFFSVSIWELRSGRRSTTLLSLGVVFVFLTFGLLRHAPYSYQALAFSLWMGPIALGNGLALLWPGASHRGAVQNWAAIPFLLVGQGCLIRVGLLVPLIWSSAHYDPTPLNLPYVGAAAILAFGFLFGYFVLSHSTPRPATTSPGRPDAPSPAPTAHPPASSLAEQYEISPREWEVALLVIQGLKSSQIADRLFISTGTVKNHLKSLYKKTSSANRADFVRRLLQGK